MIKNGLIQEIQKNGETVCSREKGKKLEKKVRAETLADLYEMGQLDQATIDKIEQTRPEVYQKAK